MKIHKDMQEVKDVWLAAYLQFCNYPALKCVAESRGDAVWTFIIPQVEFDAAKDEFDSERTQPFIRAIKDMQSLRSRARNMGGEWISGTWRNIVRDCR
jgi:hypothetical protein